MKTPTAPPPPAGHGGLGLGVTTARVAYVAGAALLVLNLLNAWAFVQRPWQDADPADSGWLLMAFEGNPSTWFTSMALLAAAATCLLLAMTEEQGGVARRRWRQLAVVPAVLSLDEVAELHERMGAALDFAGNPLTYGWVLPGLLIIAGLAALFARFVLSQGDGVRGILVTAAAIVLGGGIVVEAINGELDGRSTAAWIYLLSTTIEENLELVGILLVVVGFVEVATRRGLRLSITRA